MSFANPSRQLSNSRGRSTILAMLVSLSLVVGCAPPPAPQGINDPNEAMNRKFHEFNKGFDTYIVRPSAFGYGGAAPGPIRNGIQNFALNLGTPSDIVNGLLQGRIGNAAQNTLRFAVNTTVGLGGLFDPATILGVTAKPTDFGETLHVWGVGEGRYLDLPLIGPTTSRDVVGIGVDLVFDPMRFALPTAEANASTAIQILAGLGRRYRYTETIDSVLYQSADSYTQLRILYLENRRYELGQTKEDDNFVDPYEDPYAQ
ncbi:MAG: VacJ lipoprotein [Cereibacter sphaeroides]|uniref:VacJ lipoprotein n=1 Tax=Cereibacter sphaeroides TaxID=1063 RepID=A0A2W5UIY8_CERSP|nr:MAG: VacJ lipoprotein [Cereibacter sphaeroides]